jgi:VWFA-related protein
VTVSAFAQGAPLPIRSQASGFQLPGVDGRPLDDYKPAPMYDPSQGMIRLDVEVRDKSGRPVTGLGPQDFTLQDNSRPSTMVTFQPFDDLHPGPDPPVEVILVIDELNMPAGFQLEATEEQAQTFLRRNRGHLRQPVSIYRITSASPWTGSYSPADGNVLAEEIAHSIPGEILRKPNISIHGNPFATGRPINFNANVCLEILGSIAIEERRRPGRKLLFWLGPGWPIDRPLDSKLIERSVELRIRMLEARITMWQVFQMPLRYRDSRPLPVAIEQIPDDLKSAIGESRSLTLPALAMESGGDVLWAKEDLFSLIAKRVEEGSSFYSLTFDPAHTTLVDDYHNVSIKVAKSDMTVRTRAGYFDEPVFYDQPVPGMVPTTVDQLENAVRTARGLADREMEQRLARMQLTERLSSARLRAMESVVRGRRARQTLIALADESVFLPPPAAETLPDPPPDIKTQQEMISRAIAYVKQTIPRLPNFIAQRTTVEYGEDELKPGAPWKTLIGDRSLYARTTIKADMRYQHGKEVADEESSGRTGSWTDTLTTSGVFGPILGTVLVGATQTHGELSFSRWEKGNHTPVAVFRYQATREKNLYFTGSGFITMRDGEAYSKEIEPFHGEFAIDPASGAILRLTAQADLEPRLPLHQSDIMVEYGPQVIGGATYICPSRSVSISRERVIMKMHDWSESYNIYAPFATLLNDVTFDKYHLFHPTVRMLPGYRPATPGG